MTKHIIADLYGCNADDLRNSRKINKILTNAVLDSKGRILNRMFHKFKTLGKGVTGILLLAESHVSIHTWPESEMAAIDIFACGKINAEGILNKLIEGFSPKKTKVTKVTRLKSKKERFHK